MVRASALLVVAGLGLFQVGCDQPAPAPSSASPAGPGLVPAPSSPSQTTPGAPVTKTPTPMPAAPAASGATSITLEAAYAGMDRAATRLCELFDSIQDDASAMAAAPQIAQEGRNMAAGMEQFKKAVAVLSLAGQDDQIDNFMQQKHQEGRTPQDNLIDKMERVVNSPQHPLVRNEINGLLDGMLQAGTSGTRRGLQHAIEQKKLRR